uniref:TIL domain-containing protein n=1 Tax=Steinernema glaseri TaxID=37863 RepID=A0A1I7ZNG5_9BILA
MSSHKTILLTVFAVGLVAAGKLQPKQHTCPKNEIWLKCGVCEIACDQDRTSSCPEDCKSGCYCPFMLGLVRDANGNCVKWGECKYDCQRNEEWRECASCEATCDNPNPHESCGEHAHWSDIPAGICVSPCDLSCIALNGEPENCPAVCARRVCYCDSGYIRGNGGSCITYADCPQEFFRLN